MVAEELEATRGRAREEFGTDDPKQLLDQANELERAAEIELDRVMGFVNA